MDSYFKLSIASLLPTVLAVVFYEVNERTSFGKLKSSYKQLIYGVAFGALAVLGTEWGIPIRGAQVNCRDGAVMTAGLLFGPEAGIIAGLIGGIERWFAVYWGVGTFTRLACTVSTIIAGFYSAALRRFIFENKRPYWLLAFSAGVVMEVFHLTMIFITNMRTPEAAIRIVGSCTVPMVVANGMAVLISSIAVTLAAKERIINGKGTPSLSQTIQKKLFITVFLAFAATSLFVADLQKSLAINQAERTMTSAMEETLSEAKATDRSNIWSIARRKHIGETGYVVITDSEGDILSSPKSFSSLTRIKNDKSLLIKTMSDGPYTVYAVMSSEEAMRMRNIAVYVNTFMEILVFALLFGLVYRLIEKTVVRRIKTVNTSLGKIINGNLEEVVNVRSNAEFESLSDDINSTVNTLKSYIAKEAARIDSELAFAKEIQSSALPKQFPVCDEYEIYATMTPAADVGGDFYDFYQTSANMNILIADVSGKGIPAAMFMMRAKTELRSLTESGIELRSVFTDGNNALCDGNQAGMFVTAWQGKINLKTGVMTYVNAGHNPPLICHQNGSFEFVKNRSGLVLAGMENLNYREQEFKLNKGDIVFLYTDGVTEATDLNNCLYGEERLKTLLNSKQFSSMKDLCDSVKKDVDDFVGKALQFDDITMLAFKYNGEPDFYEISYQNAEIGNIPEATELINKELEKHDCPIGAATQISIAIDEIMSNIIKFGYGEKSGPVTVKLNVEKNCATIRFIDSGVKYNPLEQRDPDTSLSAEDRSIGGLGIFMVKKTMTDVRYQFIDNQNVLTLKKVF